MLTVKHIDPVSKNEKIHFAASVTYQHRTKNPDGLYTAAGVLIENSRGEEVHIGHWGKFYVMNEAGKTVASYDLGGEIPDGAITFSKTTTDAESLFTLSGDGVYRGTSQAPHSPAG